MRNGALSVHHKDHDSGQSNYLLIRRLDLQHGRTNTQQIHLKRRRTGRTRRGRQGAREHVQGRIMEFWKRDGVARVEYDQSAA
jgi:hypothetical protein